MNHAPQKIQMLFEWVKEHNMYITHEKDFDSRVASDGISNTSDLKAMIICSAILGEDLINNERYRGIENVISADNPAIENIRNSNNPGELTSAITECASEISHLDPGQLMFAVDKRNELYAATNIDDSKDIDEFASKSDTDAIDNSDRYTEKGFEANIHGIDVKIHDGNLTMILDGQEVNNRQIDKKEELEIIAKYEDAVFQKDKSYSRLNEKDVDNEYDSDFELDIHNLNKRL